MKLLVALALTTLLCACGKAPSALLSDARGELADGDYSAAIAAADAGLRRDPGDPVSWGLELVALEAHARSGHAAQAKERIEKLARLHPDRIPATEYAATAQQLRDAGQGPAAVEVLDLGHARFPDDVLIARMIGAAASGSGSPAELEMLRSLGYVE